MSIRRQELSSKQLALILLLPSILIILCVVIGPLVFAFYLSFFKAEPIIGGISTKFIGFSNYIYYFLKDPLFWSAVRVTSYFTVVSLVIELILGISMALVLNKSFIGRSFVRSIILLPWALPTVVNARMWEWIYAGSSFGALNGLMKVLHIFPADYDKVWLGFDVPLQNIPLIGNFMEWVGASTALNMIILADTWKVTPLVTLLVLAALQTFPESLYEAAGIDGANAWHQFWYITLPLLRPVLLVVLVLRTMELFRVFDIIYILMQYSIRVVGIYTFETGMKFLHFGKGSALSFLVGLFILGISLIYVRVLYSEEA
ncbi:sugar ABC transporter permease [Candidatus Atribacteria bacterium 1244-E10-H5-B2]|nr:MAG: sugar ABC transporter permease [Candidatus Atribacteria bacterium 1244-E10-H5-B2]